MNHDLHAELLRALEAIEQTEKLAPSGLVKQWAIMAKMRVVNALAIVEAK